MPSSPKVQKETILETALAMLLRDGYASINIKTVAKELGCSTQPISRQFGSAEAVPGTATLFFVNDDGVAITCKHVKHINNPVSYSCENHYIFSIY